MSLELVIPGIPPSVNHYKRGGRGGWGKTPEAVKFQDDIGTLLRGRHVVGKAFSVVIEINLGPKQKGDVDNFPKVVLDGLAKHGAFRDKKGKHLSDSHVSLMTISKERWAVAETWVHIEAR